MSVSTDGRKCDWRKRWTKGLIEGWFYEWKETHTSTSTGRHTNRRVKTDTLVQSVKSPPSDLLVRIVRKTSRKTKRLTDRRVCTDTFFPIN